LLNCRSRAIRNRDIAIVSRGFVFEEGMKKLIVCSDGTWDEPTGAVTNVVKLARSLRPEAADGRPQVVFYDWGLGTTNLTDKIKGGVTGAGIDKNIQDAYRFLVHNYAPGDEIHLFGFSRGAYTARSVAGLIRNAGLLTRRHADLIPKAYRLYRTKAGPDCARARAFRRDFSHPDLSAAPAGVGISMVGVWDTVGALGIPLYILHAVLDKGRYAFHDTSLSRLVRRGAHAVAIDERRADFAPTLWSRPPQDGQILEQVWFAGSHGDIGGGYRETGLSDLALLWMIDQAKQAGLAFDDDYLAAITAPDPCAKLHPSRRGIYRMHRAYRRPVGSLGPELEKIHPAVSERVERCGLGYEVRGLTKAG
jgi:uncharacterized protein (DUF2235 family)